jgi:hypothetical protein
MAKKKVVDLPGMTGPGVAPVTIAEINDLADDYIKERDKRCRLTPREVAAKEKLIASIHKHADKIGRNAAGMIVYRYDEQVITLAPGKEKLKIKDVSKDEDEEE